MGPNQIGTTQLENPFGTAKMMLIGCSFVIFKVQIECDFGSLLGAVIYVRFWKQLAKITVVDEGRQWAENANALIGREVAIRFSAASRGNSSQTRTLETCF